MQISALRGGMVLGSLPGLEDKGFFPESFANGSTRVPCIRSEVVERIGREWMRGEAGIWDWPNSII